MDDLQIRFDDGASYEEFMGKWSRLAGERFLDWLAPEPALRWADVGCGNGAFTELLLARCAPTQVRGIDPSDAQIAYARTRLAAAPATFDLGDAMALPWPDASVDAAAMALVIFFVPEPARGVAEMARVVRPGGGVSAYAWDILGGGFPFAAIQQEMLACGLPPAWPPSVEAAGLDALAAAWTQAGLVDVETTEIVVRRTFADVDDYWRVARSGPGIAPRLAALDADGTRGLRERVRARFTPGADGGITIEARANAVKGRRPAS